MFSESVACAFDSNDDGVVEESVEIAIPVYGYKTHIGIDKKHGIIRRKKPRPSDGRADREGQRAQIEGPGEGRARLRPPEGSDGADDPNRRPGPRQGRRHDGEHGVQHGSIAMASRSSQNRLRLMV